MSLNTSKIAWWKIASIALVIYSIVAGMLVPLKPGLTYVSPETAKTGQTLTLRMHGYNSFYTRSDVSDIRVWLQYDSLHALRGQSLHVLSDTVLAATFVFPNDLPRPSPSVMLNAIIDHPADGVSLLPDAVELSRDTTAVAVTAADWRQHPVGQLNIKKDFSFPYRNVIYESIRNTYFHVPMWFALMFLFVASVVYSVRFLLNPLPHFDRKAAAYAETGLLFGFMGLATGMLWAHYAWGAAWSNDIKQLMTAVALLIYMAYFILRSSFDEPEKGARLAAVYNIFAFASLIPLLYVVPRMFASLHPGATGNPAFGSQDLDNTMRMVFYPAILGFTGLGFWMAELRARYQRVADKALGLD
ncbi:MAG: cytochrome c biogenesis protein CcsA [Saprospiraceae bacterium]|nr:cytochrome c biogenesis protein CcsA [Saprospiraceae bacterium]